MLFVFLKNFREGDILCFFSEKCGFDVHKRKGRGFAPFSFMIESEYFPFNLQSGSFQSFPLAVPVP